MCELTNTSLAKKKFFNVFFFLFALLQPNKPSIFSTTSPRRTLAIVFIMLEASSFFCFISNQKFTVFGIFQVN
ncbi:hypothetical protein AQUCO_03000274v1 [Aquilegia coerulea]|uniref:Uncharacterized protein n=1 Tax=Aquilegia coerulea TaxID=218851 RepID=A0A2G5D247_AQUCA|nr:hypothetical protein AQUCO_03000274v1 [Aquilegia coerulea]PIA37590.1 hypothetical protein AQUCO_03000274v1 [Aquilegia coerulea]